MKHFKGGPSYKSLGTSGLNSPKFFPASVFCVIRNKVNIEQFSSRERKKEL
jgi:hypothetical protein